MQAAHNKASVAWQELKSLVFTLLPSYCRICREFFFSFMVVVEHGAGETAAVNKLHLFFVTGSHYSIVLQLETNRENVTRPHTR